MHSLIDEHDEPISSTRNTTDLSRFSESLVITFLDKKATSARINYERSHYDLETLYRGIYNVCTKNDFRKRVKVHKQNGELFLIRRNSG